MIIKIGSKNSVKVEAVCELIRDYQFLANARVFLLDVKSEVSKQPLSLEETVQGAINRAENSFYNCNYSFGIESGLMKVPQTKTGYMEFCVCSVYNGIRHCLGQSCAFELPPRVIGEMLKKKKDINEAMYDLKLTDQRRIGNFFGIIGDLTKNRVTRKDYTKQAIIMALIQIENQELY